VSYFPKAKGLTRLLRVAPQAVTPPAVRLRWAQLAPGRYPSQRALERNDAPDEPQPLSAREPQPAGRTAQRRHPAADEPRLRPHVPPRPPAGRGARGLDHRGAERLHLVEPPKLQHHRRRG